MKKILIPALSILLALAILTGLSLGLKGVAEKTAEAEKLKLMQTLLPGSEKFTLQTDTEKHERIRAAYKAENGCVVETVTNGYAGQIVMLIGVSNEGKVTGLVVRDMNETASIGREALNDHQFLSQFLNSSETFKVGENVDALTGATVTSRAIATAVNAAVSYATGVDTDPGVDGDTGATS